MRPPIRSRQPFRKSALTFPAQLQKLQARGLVIPDPDRALRYLANVSYYRLSGYWQAYLDHATGQFLPGTTFDDILQLYRFDKQLRLLCLDAIERLEIAFRTQLVYHLTHHTNYNNWYEEDRFFKTATPHEQGQTAWLLKTVATELGRANKKTFIAAYRRKYSHPQNPPAWMVLEVLSFGTLYNLFELFADDRPKFTIANHFNVTLKVFESWMASLNTIRNKCAHHDRFWDISLKPLLTNQGDRTGYWLRQPSAQASTTKVYYVLSVLSFLLVQVSAKSSFCAKVRQLLHDHHLLARNAHHLHMGFPTDWEQELMWAPV